MKKQITKLSYTILFLLNTTFSFAFPPVVISTDALLITNTTVRLEAYVNGNNKTTTVQFIYGTDPTFTGASAQFVNAAFGTNDRRLLDVSGLQINTIYYYRVLAINSDGNIYSTSNSFRTTNVGGAGTPEVKNLTTISTTASTATLSSEVFANNANTDVIYQYGVNATALQNSPQEFTTTQATTALYEAKQVTLTNLQSNTTYSWRVKVINSANEAISTTSTFITATNTLAPVVSNVSATDFTSTTAKILYRVENEGFTSKIWYGTSSNALNNSIDGTVGVVNANTSSIITGLLANTQYFYRVEVTNDINTVQSVEQSFTTDSGVPIAEFNFNGNFSNSDNTLTFTDPGISFYGQGRDLMTNGALELNNFRRNVNIPNLPTAKAARTVSIWAKTAGYTDNDYNYIFGYGTSQNSRAYGVAIYKSGTAYSLHNYTYADDLSTISGTFDNANGWHHYVSTFDGTTATLYVDGVVKASGDKPNWDTNTGNFFIGGSSFANNFFGSVDDLKIYNRALTTQEVTNLYTTNNVVLPVIMISYTAKSQNNNAVLSWKTASEINNSHFVITKSTEGKNFSQLAVVNAKSAQGADYIYTDYNTTNGINYYRLTQIDLNGKATDLGVKAVKMSLADTDVKLYPNPATDFVNLSFEAGLYSKATLSDINGKVMSSSSIAKIQNTIAIDLGNVTPGTYLVQLTGKSNKTIRKVIKK